MWSMCALATTSMESAYNRLRNSRPQYQHAVCRQCTRKHVSCVHVDCKSSLYTLFVWMLNTIQAQCSQRRKLDTLFPYCVFCQCPAVSHSQLHALARRTWKQDQRKVMLCSVILYKPCDVTPLQQQTAYHSVIYQLQEAQHRTWRHTCHWTHYSAENNSQIAIFHC